MDGQIRRWDISGEGKKRESEIINTVEKNGKNDKKKKIVEAPSAEREKIEKIESDSKENKKNVDGEKGKDGKEEKGKDDKGKEDREGVYRKRRFLDFYFDDAIQAETARRTAADAGSLCYY